MPAIKILLNFEPCGLEAAGAAVLLGVASAFIQYVLQILKVV